MEKQGAAGLSAAHACWALARWYRARTADGHNGFRKTMIVALAGELLIALWRLVMTGETEGVSLRQSLIKETTDKSFGA